MNTIMHFLSSDMVSDVVLNAFLQLAVASLIGWLAIMLCRRKSASLRSTISLYALATLLLIGILSPIANITGKGFIRATIPPNTMASGVTASVPVANAALKPESTPVTDVKTGAVPADLSPLTEPSPFAAALDLMLPAEPFLTRADILFAANCFGLLWLAGSIAMLLHLGYGLIFLRGFRSGLRKLDSANIVSLLADVEKTFPGCGHVKVYASPVIHSPVAVGIVTPIIILPESLYADATQTELKSIFLHELAHINRLDHIMGLFQRIVLALNWWNPLVHLINKTVSIAKEEISDNYAIRGIGSARSYSECLINLADKVCLISNLPATAGMAGKYISLEQRVININAKDRKMNVKTTTAVRLTGCAMMLAASICVAGTAVEIEKNSDNATPEEVITQFVSAVNGIEAADVFTPIETFKSAAKRNPDEFLETALRLLKSDDEKMVAGAVTVLRILKDNRAVEPLIELLNDQNETKARLRAVHCLSALDDERALAALVNTLSDKDITVRSQACLALARLGDKRAVEPSLTLLEGKPTADGMFACMALAFLKDERGVPYAVEALNSKDASIHNSAVSVLAFYGDKRAIEPLIALLNDKDANARLLTISLLSRFKEKRVVEALKKRQSIEPNANVWRSIQTSLNILEPDQ